jgi:SAM-dependent methyltransferase
MLIRGIPRYLEFFKDWVKYSKSKGAETIKLINTYPCIHEKTQTTNFDIHYFYQDIWAFKRIYESKPNHHYDIGSAIDFVGFLTAITKVTFVDIRPLLATLDNFASVKGSILSLPFKENSLLSLSSLHVVEHIGLGRYGDPIDPSGTKKACKELSRILAPNGNLYFSVPVGKPRLCFNAHRIHSPKQITDYFSDLELVELSGIDDKGQYIRNIDTSILESADYGCGLFWFRKK